MIALDTSVVIDLLREASRGQVGAVTRHIGRFPESPIALPVFVLCELEAGAARARDPEGERKRVRSLADRCEILYPDETFAPRFGEVSAHVLGRGTPRPTMDLLIAVSAICAGAKLLTRDRRGFSSIPGLVLESIE